MNGRFSGGRSALIGGLRADSVTGAAYARARWVLYGAVPLYTMEEEVAIFEDIADRLRDCTTAGPASQEMIGSAESRLGVHFPPSYRQFLATYGAAVCSGFEIAGLFSGEEKDEPPLWSDVVASTLRIRRVARFLPSGHVAISDDGGDHTYYLDTAKCKPGEECPVVALGPGVDGVTIGENFLDFVVRSFERRISF